MKRKIKDQDDLKAVYKKNKFLTNPTKGELQNRGYELESILEFLIAPYELRASYKSEGEQIDGSFFIWGQTFLLEAKWLKDPASASSLYAFKGKVDGKFHTTSGIYLSMKGYSNDAVNALRYGKSINVLLFTDDDLDYIIEKDVPFETVLKFKLRQAGDSGSPNAPYKLTKAAAGLALQTPILSGSTIHLSVPPSVTSDQSAYLVFYPSSFPQHQVQAFFADLPTQAVERFRFYQINDGDTPLDTIAVIVSINATDSEAPEIRGLIVLVDERHKDDEQEVQLRLDLPEIIKQSSYSMPLGIFTIPQDYLEIDFDSGEKEKNAPLRKILQFLEDGMQTNNFFFDDAAIYPAVKILLDNATWNFKNKTVTLYDIYDNSPVLFKDYSSLAGHLEEIAKDAASGETPTEILKDEGYPDYDEEIGKILNQYPEIKKLGWL